VTGLKSGIVSVKVPSARVTVDPTVLPLPVSINETVAPMAISVNWA
jgi:hypothetical protein